MRRWNRFPRCKEIMDDKKLKIIKISMFLCFGYVGVNHFEKNNGCGYNCKKENGEERMECTLLIAKNTR